jgi:AraC family transcriptional regulator
MGGVEQEEASGLHLKPGHYYGEVLNRHHCGGLVLSEVRHSHGKRLPKHSHELAFFSLLLEGAYRESYGKRSVALKPFTVIYQPPGLIHEDEIAPGGMRLFCIEIKGERLDRLREYAAMPDSSSDLHGGELSWLATRLYREYRDFGCRSALVIEGLSLEMLGLAARRREAREKRAPVWLARAVELLHAEFDRNLTVRQVAEEVGIHPIHLSKVFRQFHHQSIGEYLHRLRVQFACRQLALGEVELGVIASAMGFADQSHFTRVFKRIVGTTPGEFRAALLSGTLADPTKRSDHP